MPPLVLVSNRGPVTYQDDGSVKRGGGGLVTALTGLASHRDAVWIASALTPADAQKAEEEQGRPFSVRSPAGGEYQVRLVASDPEAYDRQARELAQMFADNFAQKHADAPPEVAAAAPRP